MVVYWSVDISTGVTVTTRIIMFLVRGPNLNLHLPRLHPRRGDNPNCINFFTSQKCQACLLGAWSKCFNLPGGVAQVLMRELSPHQYLLEKKQLLDFKFIFVGTKMVQVSNPPTFFSKLRIKKCLSPPIFLRGEDFLVDSLGSASPTFLKRCQETMDDARHQLRSHGAKDLSPAGNHDLGRVAVTTWKTAVDVSWNP